MIFFQIDSSPLVFGGCFSAFHSMAWYRPAHVVFVIIVVMMILREELVRKKQLEAPAPKMAVVAARTPQITIVRKKKVLLWSATDLETKIAAAADTTVQRKLGAGARPVPHTNASCAFVNPAWGLPQRVTPEGEYGTCTRMPSDVAPFCCFVNDQNSATALDKKRRCFQVVLR